MLIFPTSLTDDSFVDTQSPLLLLIRTVYVINHIRVINCGHQVINCIFFPDNNRNNQMLVIDEQVYLYCQQNSCIVNNY